MSIRTKIQNTNLKSKAKFYQQKLDLLSDSLLVVPVDIINDSSMEHSGDYSTIDRYNEIKKITGFITYPDDMIGTTNIVQATSNIINTLRMNEDLPVKFRTFEFLKTGDIIIDYVANGDNLEDIILTFLSVSGFTHDMTERTRTWKIYQLTQSFDFLKKAPDGFEEKIKTLIVEGIKA